MSHIQPGRINAGGPQTNQAHVVAQGGWVSSPDGQFGANIVHLDAILSDLTPHDPLKPLDWGSYAVRIHSGEVRVREQEATSVAQQVAGPILAAEGLSHPQVRFLKDGRVRLSAALNKAGIPWPVAVDFQLARQDGHTVRVSPQLNVLHKLAGGLTGRDFVAEFASKLPGARVTPEGSVLLDIRQLPHVTATLHDIRVEKGRVVVNFKEPGVTDHQREQRRGSANWVQIETHGELSTPDGNVNNARALVENGAGPEYPIYLNHLPHGVKIHLERGDLVITESAIATAIAEKVPEFKLKSARFKGTTLHLSGSYQVPASAIGGLFGMMLGGARGFVSGVNAGKGAQDLGVPVNASLAFALTPDGKLSLTPAAETTFAGPLRRALLDLPGAQPTPTGVILDFEHLAGLKGAKPRGLREDRGRLVIQH
jgi:hypothetical protein